MNVHRLTIYGGFFGSLLCVLALVGCDLPPELAEIAQDANSVASQPASTLPASNAVLSASVPAKSPNNILVASFNIQVFGMKKAQDAWIMERLAHICRHFDVIGIQEIRSTDDRVMPELIRYINADGSQYAFVISERLGRTVSKEQYAYVFDTTRIVTHSNASYTVVDDSDLMHRQPYVARFVAQNPRNPFRFTAINVHTDPDVAAIEVDVLADVFQNVRAFEMSTAKEDDVLLLGDFNASPQQMRKLGALPGFLAAITNQPTNVSENKIFDNVIMDRYATVEYTGRSGVLLMRELFGFSREEARRLSDHNPVWAEFTSWEATAATARAEVVPPTRR